MAKNPSLHDLRELDPTRQVEGERPRRWFASPRADLIVWLEEDGSLNGFQFCYDKDGTEHALTWMERFGYSHMRVDKGRTFEFGGRGTPFLVPDGLLDAPRILALFEAQANSLPEEYRAFVRGKLWAFAERFARPAR
jgi:hypothetical protein